jgi:hypothetical protein
MSSSLSFLCRPPALTCPIPPPIGPSQAWTRRIPIPPPAGPSWAWTRRIPPHCRPLARAGHGRGGFGAPRRGPGFRRRAPHRGGRVPLRASGPGAPRRRCCELHGGRHGWRAPRWQQGRGQSGVALLGGGGTGRSRSGLRSSLAAVGVGRVCACEVEASHEEEERGREGDGRQKWEQSGSVPQILADGANPHLASIFPLEPLRSDRSSSKQPWERISSTPLPNQTHG